MNCLSYALRFWKKHPNYRIYYNSDHCINLRDFNFFKSSEWLALDEYGLDYFKSAFKDELTKKDLKLLEEYF